MHEEDAVEHGEQNACNALGEWLGVEPAWLHHIVGTYGKCECTFDTDGIGYNYCETYREQEDARFKEFHGITREQWQARQAEQRKRAAQAAAAERHHTLEELAQEQGIDPRLLP